MPAINTEEIERVSNEIDNLGFSTDDNDVFFLKAFGVKPYRIWVPLDLEVSRALGRILKANQVPDFVNAVLRRHLNDVGPIL